MGRPAHPACEIRVRVSVVVTDGRGRLLLVRHRKDGREYWLLPGGGQNPGEGLEDAARRELSEELRLHDVTAFTFLGLREAIDPAGSRHLLLPLLQVRAGDLRNPNLGEDERIVGFDWLDAARLAAVEVRPALGDDLVALAEGRAIAPYRRLDWIG